MEKRKCPSYFGDYKCHVKTNVKDSKGDFVYVDKCLKEAVENLNAVGLKTIASCCGHGIINPKITIEGLSDGKPDNLESGKLPLHVVTQRSELFALLKWMQNEPEFNIDDINEILDDYAFYKANCG